MTVQRLYSVLAAVVSALVVAASASADWADDFDGSLDQTWAFQGIGGDPPGPVGTMSGGVDQDTLLLQDPNTVLAGGSATGFGIVPTETFTDVLVSGDINPLGEDAINTFAGEMGLLARGNTTTLSSYALTLVYFENASPNPDLQLEIVEITGPGGGNVLATADVPGFTSASTYHLEFELVGDQLTGRVFDQQGGTLIASASATNGNLTEGVSGVLAITDIAFGAGDPNDVLFGRYDNVSSSAISSAIVGDSNGDGVVNTLDIDPFVLALTDPAQYAIDFPAVDFLGANDINSDEMVNTLDIDPFVALLTGSAAAAPEPGGAVLTLLAAGCGLVRRRAACVIARP